MARVYLAVQENLDRKVALKVMDPALARDRSLCQRFLKEGRFVARMSSHPDIVTINMGALLVSVLGLMSVVLGIFLS